MSTIMKRYSLPLAALAAWWLLMLPLQALAGEQEEAINPEARTEAAGGSDGAAPAASQSFYVVNENLYVVMERPAARGYGAFSMLPVLMTDSEVGFEEAAGGPAAETGDQTGPALAVNLNFRGAADYIEEPPSNSDNRHMEEDIPDPFEPLNRLSFSFNDKFYFLALKPAATVYSFLVPEWGRMRVRNFMTNIQAPVRMANALLQLKMHTFGAEFAKFVLNSTFGVLGFFDLGANHPELKTSEEDLGQTLGTYGISEGFYLVLPFLGPSSFRDSIGMAGDYFLSPIGHLKPLEDEAAVRAVDWVNETSLRIGDYEDIKESAVDPYISIRDIYKQYRRAKVRE